MELTFLKSKTTTRSQLQLIQLNFDTSMEKLTGGLYGKQPKAKGLTRNLQQTGAGFDSFLELQPGSLNPRGATIKSKNFRKSPLNKTKEQKGIQTHNKMLLLKKINRSLATRHEQVKEKEASASDATLSKKTKLVQIPPKTQKLTKKLSQ